MGAAVVADASGGGVGDREGARCSWLRGGSTVERSGGGDGRGRGEGRVGAGPGGGGEVGTTGGLGCGGEFSFRR